MTELEREAAQVERAERTHRAVLEAMAKERPGKDMYTWRDRYLALFQMLWDRPASESLPTPPLPRRVSGSNEARQPQDQVDNQNGDD